MTIPWIIRSPQIKVNGETEVADNASYDEIIAAIRGDFLTDAVVYFPYRPGSVEPETGHPLSSPNY